MSYKSGVIVLIEPSEIATGPNCRWVELDEAKVEEYAESFRDKGQLQPVLLRRAGDGVEMVAGHHRRAAMIRHNERYPDAPKKLKAIVGDMNAEEALEKSIVENRFRNNPSPMDDAFAQRRLREEFGWPDTRIAEFYRYDPSHVSNLKRLLVLDKPTQLKVHARTLSMATALDLSTLPESERQEIAAAEGNGQVRQRARTAVRERKIAAGGAKSRTVAEVRTFFEQLVESNFHVDLSKLLLKFVKGEITEDTMKRNLGKLVQA